LLESNILPGADVIGMNYQKRTPTFSLIHYKSLLSILDAKCRQRSPLF